MSKPRAAKRTKSYAVESDDEEVEEEMFVGRKPRAAKKRTKSYAVESDDEEVEKRAVGRKKSSKVKSNGFEDLDLSKRSTTAKVVAEAILALLPEDATKQHSSAKALVSLIGIILLIKCTMYLRCDICLRLISVGQSVPIGGSRARG
jgi:TnpA family transposase